MNSRQGEDAGGFMLNFFMGDGDHLCHLTYGRLQITPRLSVSDGGRLYDGGGCCRRKLDCWRRS